VDLSSTLAMTAPWRQSGVIGARRLGRHGRPLVLAGGDNHADDLILAALILGIRAPG